MAKAWADFTGGMGKSADPRKWAQAHPWISVASATVAGFAAATVVVPSKEEQALKKLAAIERALRGSREDRERPNGDGHERESKDSRGGGFLSRIIQEAFGALRPLLMSIISSHLGGQPPQQDPTAEDPTGGAGAQPPPGAAYYQGPQS